MLRFLILLALLSRSALTAEPEGETSKQRKRGILEDGWVGIPSPHGYGHGQPWADNHNPWKALKISPSLHHNHGGWGSYGGADKFHFHKHDLHVHPEIPYSGGLPVYITKHIVVEKPVPVPQPVYIEKAYHVPVEKIVPIPVETVVHKPVPIPVPVPQAVPIPVKHPVAVPVQHPFPVPVKHAVPYPVPVPYPIAAHSFHHHGGNLYGSGHHHGAHFGGGGHYYPHHQYYGYGHPYPYVHGFGHVFGHGHGFGHDYHGHGHGYGFSHFNGHDHYATHGRGESYKSKRSKTSSDN